MEQFASPRESLFDCVLAQFEGLGDALHGIVFAIIEDKRLPINFRKPAQGPPHNSLLFFADGQFRRQRFGSGDLLYNIERFGADGGFTSVAPDTITGAIADDPAKPGAELGRFAQVAKPLPRNDKCFLGRVFALAEIANDTVSERA